MKKFMRTFVLLLLVASLVGCFCLTASAAEFGDSSEALEYLDSYSDNVATDEAFEANIAAALDLVREDVSFYATFVALIPPIIAIALALITKEV